MLGKECTMFEVRQKFEIEFIRKIIKLIKIGSNNCFANMISLCSFLNDR